MRFLGLDVTRARPLVLSAPAAAPDVERAAAPGALAPVNNAGGGWWPLLSVVMEPFAGAWQRGSSSTGPTNLTEFGPVFACITRIAQDISKLPIRVVEQGADGIWRNADVPAFSPVLRKPNTWQTRIQFFEQWMASKLCHGNTYVLKGRSGRNTVDSLYVLNPKRVQPLVTEDGDVYYRLGRNEFAGINDDSVVVPASEIIHDRINCLAHPLIGISPIAACALAANNGLAIQRNSSKFFSNGSRPSGILTAPGQITKAQAEDMKTQWEDNYSGANVFKTAILGGGLKYEAVAVNAVDSELIKQLMWDERAICTVFHVPTFMVNVGELPKYDNIEALQQQYYTQCLQRHLEDIELLLDEGLGLLNVPSKTYGTEFDLDVLLRMDTQGVVKAETQLVKGMIKAPNEARRRLNLDPVEGGDSPMSQQQNYSLAALARRDAGPDPFRPAAPGAPAPAPAPAPAATPADKHLLTRALAAEQLRGWVSDVCNAQH